MNDVLCVKITAREEEKKTQVNSQETIVCTLRCIFLCMKSAL